MNYECLSTEKLVECVQLYKNSRNKDTEVYENIFDRLYKLFNIFPSRNKEVQEVLEEKKSSISNRLVMTLRQVARVPAYYKQLCEIRKKFKNSKEVHGVIAIASNRLEIDRKLGVRETVIRMSQVVGNKHDFEEIRSLRNGRGAILMFDALLESRYWPIRRQFNEDGVYIVDGGFLIFIVICTFFSSFIRNKKSRIMFIRSYFQSNKKNDKNKESSFFSKLKEAFIFISYLEIFSGIKIYNASLFTSNSWLTEMLRFYLLQDLRCNKIVEVLHGIVANPTEKYLHSVLEVSDHNKNNARHFFIPQIPELPSLNLLSKAYFYPNDVSVNTYINKVITKNKEIFGSIDEYIKFRCDENGLNCNATNFKILTMFGACSIEGAGKNYYTSERFRVELYLLDLAISCVHKNDLKIKFMYAPHPANSLFLDSSVLGQELKKRNINLVTDSVFCHFVSDYCMSIFSSCLFEMNWMGAESFSPLISTDNFYSQPYLEKIHYPKNGDVESVTDAVKIFINTNIDKQQNSLIDRVNNRMCRYVGDINPV